MKSSVLAFVVLALSAFGEASHSRHAQVAESKRAIHQLVARQSIDPSSVPATCDSQCSAILNDITTCQGSTDLTCICNTTTENSFVDCLNCMLSAAAASPDDISTAQTQVDQYIDICTAAGVSLPSITVGSSTSSGTDTDTNADTNTDASNATPTDDAAITLDDSTATATIDPVVSTSTPALVVSVSATSSSSADASTASTDYSAPNHNGALVSTGSLGVAVASFLAMVGGFVAL